MVDVTGIERVGTSFELFGLSVQKDQELGFYKNLSQVSKQVVQTLVRDSAFSKLEKEQEEAQLEIARQKEKERYSKISAAEAEASFGYTLEARKHEASGYPNPQEVFQEFSDQAILDVNAQYGPISAEHQGRLKVASIKAQTDLLKESYRAGASKARKTIENAYTSISTASIGIPEDTVNSSLKVLHNEAANAFGFEYAEIQTKNAEEISKDRRKMHLEDTKRGNTNLPVITSPVDTVPLTSVSTSDMSILQHDNPLLARAFIRTKTMSVAEGEDLARAIETQFPNSPEPQAIRMANSIKESGISGDAITYGQHQNFFQDEPLHIEQPFSRSSSMDRRLSHTKLMIDRFGVSNIFTNDEKMTLRRQQTPIVLASMTIATKQFNDYNASVTQDKRIPKQVLINDLRSIDNNVFTWKLVTDNFPEFAGVNYEVVNNIAGNKELLTKILNDTDQDFNRTHLYVTSDVVGFKKIMGDLQTATFLQNPNPNSTNGYKFEDFFSQNDTYFYPHGVDGSKYLGNARFILKNRYIRLKNTGISTYKVLNSNGTPFFLNGKEVLYDGKELENVPKTSKDSADPALFSHILF